MDLRFNNASVIRLRISLSTINSTQTNSPKRFLHKTHDFNGIKISIKFYSSITIRKSFINSRNKIEELVQVEEVKEKKKKKGRPGTFYQQTNCTESTGEEKNYHSRS
jgi:hypothetical protein